MTSEPIATIPIHLTDTYNKETPYVPNTRLPVEAGWLGSLYPKWSWRKWRKTQPLRCLERPYWNQMLKEYSRDWTYQTQQRYSVRTEYILNQWGLNAPAGSLFYSILFTRYFVQVSAYRYVCGISPPSLVSGGRSPLRSQTCYAVLLYKNLYIGWK